MDDRLRILIVDDLIPDAESVRRLLDEAGIKATVYMAHSLSEAKAKLSPPCPDIVLLDLGLPGCEGLEALQAVAAACVETSIIVITGSENEMLMMDSAEYGAHEYITKSELTAPKLRRAIRSAVKQRDRYQRAISIISRANRIESDAKIAVLQAQDIVKELQSLKDMK